MRATVLLLALLAGPLVADPPRPSLVVIDPVAPPPQPMPGPAAGVKLDAGRFELLRLDGYSGKVLWRASGPAARVTRLEPKSRVYAVTPDPADTPFAKFAGEANVVVVFGLKAGATGGNRYEVGDAPAAMVRGGEAGTATVEAWGVIDGEPVLLTQLLVESGKTPQPEPPKPTPDPAPTPGTPVKFVVVVEETQDAAAGRGAFFASPEIAARVKAKGLRWRVVDKDVVGADGKPPADVARFLSLAAGKPYPSVFLVDAAGKLLDQRPVPPKPADLLTLLTQFGG